MQCAKKTARLVAACLLVLFPTAGIAAEEEQEQAVVWLERTHPKDALAETTRKIEVMRRGEAVAFKLPVHMANLYEGDIIRINDDGAYLYLWTGDSGRLRVDAATAENGEYPIRVRKNTVLGKFAALINRLRGGEPDVEDAFVMRGEDGEAAYPAILEDPEVAFKLAAGKGDLHVRWRGGEAPFLVRVLAGDRILGAAESAAERAVTLPGLDLPPGSYELVIKDKRGLAPGVDPLRGSADVETLVAASDGVPPMPPELAETPLPDETRRLLYARWLAGEERGAWLLEALRIAAPLAEAYPPAGEWLELWSGKEAR